MRLMALPRCNAIGIVENWITQGGKVSVNLLFFKMRNNQPQSQIQYNSRVKEREKPDFQKRNISYEFLQINNGCAESNEF